MALKEKDKAPHFAVFDINGELVDLSDYRNKKILIGFYRHAACPFSNLRIDELKRYEQEFKERGLEIISVFQSPKESVKRYVGKQRPGFHLIDDPRMTLYYIYKVGQSFFKPLLFWTKVRDYYNALGKGFRPGKQEGNRFRMPAEFIIDENMQIHTLKYGEDINDFLSLEAIRAVL